MTAVHGRVGPYRPERAVKKSVHALEPVVIPTVDNDCISPENTPLIEM